MAAIQFPGAVGVLFALSAELEHRRRQCETLRSQLTLMGRYSFWLEGCTAELQQRVAVLEASRAIRLPSLRQLGLPLAGSKRPAEDVLVGAREPKTPPIPLHLPRPSAAETERLEALLKELPISPGMGLKIFRAMMTVLLKEPDCALTKEGSDYRPIAPELFLGAFRSAGCATDEEGLDQIPELLFLIRNGVDSYYPRLRAFLKECVRARTSLRYTAIR